MRKLERQLKDQETLEAIEAASSRKTIYDAAKELEIEGLPDSPEKLSDRDLIRLYEITSAVQSCRDTYEDIGLVEHIPERNMRFFQAIRQIYGGTVENVREGITRSIGILGESDSSNPQPSSQPGI